MDPRLRCAVDSSRAWYDDVFALHAIPTKVEAGVWWALGPPPPWHSGVKTTRPGVGADQVLAVDQGATVADSFGDLDLAPYGFTVLVDARWVHHGPRRESSSALPDGWSVVRDPGLLDEWSRAHDYAGVLTAAALERSQFTVLARHVDGALVGGVVLHRRRRHDPVGLSNAWSAGSDGVDHAELLAVAGAVHGGAPVTGYARGTDLTAMVATGYTVLGPQRVWVRAGDTTGLAVE